MSVPDREPVFDTVNVTKALPRRATVGVTERLAVWKVVYDSP
jgi:hypothetical protein